MALTNINSPSFASDVVGVFDQNFAQVFPLARPVKAIIDESAKAFEHPLESGFVITDHIIFEPNEIELQMILPAGEYRSVYQQIEQLYKARAIFSVQTRATTYTNMFIYRIPHQEDADKFNTISISIRLRQILIVATASQALTVDQVANPTNQSTITTGPQQTGPSQALPPPATFDAAKAADGAPPGVDGVKLPAGVIGPAPNQQSYDNYPGNDLPVKSLTQDQLEQIITAKGFPKIDK